ncbi:alpha/beta hydrolase-fold protein [Gordonia sp. L191]|uniref:alpha/beta hydrolase n=1 Tax=Gordonia sp. L191 TaxID=2982699 RepID=UPI0024BF8E1E|nr:alpha/beta hydrolase-fold protein [Gordonia sp. L191]WHU47714.1 alpha/beta hydrolase-fold protein [Gordonia sp. L191]
MVTDNLAVVDLPLLSPWITPAVLIVAAVVLVMAIWRRSNRWLRYWSIGAASLAVAGVAGVFAMFQDSGIGYRNAPFPFWISVGAVGIAVVTAVAGVPRGRWWQRLSAAGAIPVAVVAMSLVSNQWLGYFPTTDKAWATISGQPVPRQVELADLTKLRGTMPANGRILRLPNKLGPSGFRHRTEYVYLPPAWFAGNERLTAVVMVGGVLTTPTDWIRAGNAVDAADAYARTHRGVAPILIFVDPTGSFGNDTECVDSPRGKVESHIVTDVVPWVARNLGQPAGLRFMMAGWSMGGTCAVTLALRSPEVFGGFVAISTDRRPAVGDKATTVRTLFGGDEHRWAEHDPMSVMRSNPRRLRGMSAYYAAAGDKMRTIRGVRTWSSSEIDTARDLADAGRTAGLTVATYFVRGGHTWPFAAQAFASALPFLTRPDPR